MADYQLTSTDQFVIRTKVDERNPDPVWIPNDPGNTHWMEYQNWLAEGGVPDPYVEPPPAPPTDGEEVAFDHENRIRALEGQPPLSMSDFVTSTRKLKT